MFSVSVEPKVPEVCGDFSSDMDVLADPLAHLSVSAFILAHGGK